MVALLDHVVINTLRGMAAAAETFIALGFTLTPLGRHSLGSINHLMMTSGAYLELVGVPNEGKQRQEVLDSPFGLNGLVLGSSDADATFARLTAHGLPALAPTSFSRPVVVDGVAQDARFRTVRMAAEAFPAGRVYHCEHLTPELVWRPEWLAHANGFMAIDELVIGGPNTSAAARAYAAVCDAEAKPRGDDWIVALGDVRLRLVQAPRSRFAALGLRFAALDDLARRAERLAGITWRRHGVDSADLEIEALDLHLQCRIAA